MVERKRSLEINLRARNLSAQAFTQVQRSLARIRTAGREAMGGLARGAASAKGQLIGLVAAVGGVQKLIIEPAKFEEALTKITLAGAGFENKIKEIQRVIEDLAVSTGSSRDALGTGFEAAARRVKTFEEAVRLVTVANKLAAVSGGEIEDSVTGLSAVIEGFELDVSDLNKIAAQLFATTQRLPESASEIQTEIGKIAPIAREAGLGIDDLLAAIVTAEQGGVRASATLTGLRTVFDAISGPVGLAKKAFEDMGIQTGRLSFENRDLGEAFNEIIVAARKADIPLKDLGISARAASAFFAVAAKDGKAFGDELASINAKTATEFEAAFTKVNEVTASTIRGLQELAKVAASAFNGSFAGDLNASLQKAASQIDEIRAGAELVGLNVQVWAQRMRPALAVASTFIESLDLGFGVIRTAIESLGAVGKTAFLSIKLSALSVADEITQAYNDVANGIVNTLASISPALFGDTAKQIAELSKEIDQLREQGAGISRGLVEDLRSARSRTDGNAEQFTQIAQDEISDPKSLNRQILARIQEEIEALNKARALLVEEVEQTGNRVGSLRFDISADTSGLKAEIAETLQELQTLEGPLREELGELAARRLDQYEKDAQDVRDAFFGIGDAAEVSAAQIRELEERIAAVTASRELLREARTAPVQGPREVGQRGPIPESVPHDEVPQSADTSALDEARAAVAEAARVAEEADADLAGREAHRAAARAALIEKEKQLVLESQARIAEVRSAFQDGLARSLTDFILGTTTAKEAFHAFAESVIRDIARIAAQRLATEIFAAATSGGGGAAPAADGGALPAAPAATGGVLPVVPFAEGGPITRLGGKVPAEAGGLSRSQVPEELRARAQGDGGGSPGRVIGLLAEAGMPEAVVPLQASGSVPLAIENGQPVVMLPGSKGSIPVQITGKGVTDEQARASLIESLGTGKPQTAQLGGGQGFAGILREPTIGMIPDDGQRLAAIPLPRGEAIPIEVDAQGVARVTLPRGRSLPAAARGAGGSPGQLPAVPVQPFAEGGIIGESFARARQGLALLAEAGMPEAVVPLQASGSVPLAIENGKPVVTLPGGKSIAVQITGQGVTDEEATAALVRSIGSGGGASVAQLPREALAPQQTAARGAEAVGEAVQLSVDAQGVARVTLPQGAALPAELAAAVAPQIVPAAVPEAPSTSQARGAEDVASGSRSGSTTIDEDATARPGRPPRAAGIPAVPAVELPAIPASVVPDLPTASVARAPAAELVALEATPEESAERAPAAAVPPAAAAVPAVELPAIPAAVVPDLPPASVARAPAAELVALEATPEERAERAPAAAAVPAVELPAVPTARAAAVELPAIPAAAIPDLPTASGAVPAVDPRMRSDAVSDAVPTAQAAAVELPAIPAAAVPHLPTARAEREREEDRKRSASAAARSRFVAVRRFADGGEVSPEGLPPRLARQVERMGARGGALGLFAEAGMPEALVPLDAGGAVPLVMMDGAPAVSLPGGKSVPVKITGKGITDEEATAMITAQMGSGASSPATVGSPDGPMGILREPTIARIPEAGGASMAAIPLPRGEAIPIEVDAQGVARVTLPRGRGLPASVQGAGRSRGLEEARAFASGGVVNVGTSSTAARISAFKDGGAVVSTIRGSSSSTPQVVSGMDVGGGTAPSIFNIKFQALDGPGVERVLSTPEGKRAIESVFRNARATRRDF